MNDVQFFEKDYKRRGRGLDKIMLIAFGSNQLLIYYRVNPGERNCENKTAVWIYIGSRFLLP